MSEDQPMVTINFEVNEGVYAVMQRNAVKGECDIPDYLCMLALADDENPAFLMELLRRTEKIDDMSNFVECTYRIAESVISDVVQIQSDLTNLKENFEYEYGEYGNDDPMHD
jgi:hypothetical protein